MKLNDLLSRLPGVKQRGARCSATCPAHADRSPSLSISEGDRGLLLKCWAGCTIKEICAALGIESKDLFYDAGLPRNQRPAPRHPRISKVSRAFQFELTALDLRLRAQKILEVTKHLDASAFTDDELEKALSHVSQAYADHERAEIFEDVADGLRFKEFHERESREQRQRVA